MNFNNASGLNFQGTSVKEAWLNGTQVYKSPTIWTFATPAAGRTITGFSVSTTIGTILINWGDGTSNTINSDALVNKTY